ncbi:MAG: hypothetical protein WC614_01585 [bacterium]
MRNIGKKEAIENLKNWGKVCHHPQKEVQKHIKHPSQQKKIDEILKDVPLLKVKRAKAFWNKWCKEIMKNEELEQIYRALDSSLKTNRSYWQFKRVAILFLYIYGYISDKELDLIKKDIDKTEQIFDKHRKEMKIIKEIDDALRDKKFRGHIPMNVSCLAIGASITFTRAVKAILDVIERLHKDKDYREGHYYGGTIDWDEAILFSGQPYEWCKKGGKNERDDS